MLRYKLINKLDEKFSEALSFNAPDGVEYVSGRNISLPFSELTRDDGYSDLVNKLFVEEKDNNVNVPLDNETIKFTAAKLDEEEPTSVTLQMYFYNTTADTFNNTYTNAGFNDDEITGNRNNILNSFFRIDFYDSPNQREQNFLFSEFLTPKGSDALNKFAPTFKFNRIFYRKADPKFTVESTFIDLYFEILFFNAKDGTIRNLVNKAPGTISLDQYNLNPNLRFAKVKLLNPYFNQPGVGNQNNIFYVEPINGNTNTEIIFSELIISN